MKRYTFKVEVYGYGEDGEEAEIDALEFVNGSIRDLDYTSEIVEVDEDTFEPIDVTTNKKV